jgi:hypothetical protein
MKRFSTVAQPLPRLLKMPILTRRSSFVVSLDCAQDRLLSYVAFFSRISHLVFRLRSSVFRLRQATPDKLWPASLMRTCVDAYMRFLICSSTHLLIYSQALGLCVNYILYQKITWP